MNTQYCPETHHRRSIRFRCYDYSKAGAYFVTICTHNRDCVFGKIIDGEMLFHEFGTIVSQQWGAIPERFPGIELDAFVVMPNHIHGILLVGAPLAGAPMNAVSSVGAPLAGALFDAGSHVSVGARVDAGVCEHMRAPARGANTEEKRAPARGAPTVGEIIGTYKSLTMYHCLQWVKQHKPQRYLGKLWQRNYYEHIIRDDDDLNRIREYIINNPAHWQDDDEYKISPSLAEENAS